VTNFITGSYANNILLVSDSCYSGLIGQSIVAKRYRGSSDPKFLKTMLQARSRILITSGGDKPVADFGGSGHSIFAQAFIDALNAKRSDAFISHKLFSYVREKVTKTLGSHQVPRFYRLRNAGHEDGDFVFQMH
jgi:hypothetical protein